MSVGRICVRDVDFADPQESVWQAAERMRDRAVGTLVILNDQREPIGMVTDRDLTERVLAERRDPIATKVRDVMTQNPSSVAEDSSIESALRLMRGGRFRRLPVVNRDGQLVGLLSLDDVLMLVAEEFQEIGQLLERETPCGIAGRL